MDGLTLSFLSAITSLDADGECSAPLPQLVTGVCCVCGSDGVATMIEDLGNIDPPASIMAHLSSPSGDSHALTLPLSLFYPANLGKHFKVHPLFCQRQFLTLPCLEVSEQCHIWEFVSFQSA